MGKRESTKGNADIMVSGDYYALSVWYLRLSGFRLRSWQSWINQLQNLELFRVSFIINEIQDI